MGIDREVNIRKAIKYCIEKFDTDTATNRIVEFWKDELESQINRKIIDKKQSEHMCINCKENPANRGLGKHKLVCSDCWNTITVSDKGRNTDDLI